MADRKVETSPLLVLDDSGSATPFLRGVLTHHLIGRGVDFDTAYALARSIKSKLQSRKTVGVAELRELVDEELEESLPQGAVLAARPPRLSVTYKGEAQPFSRGVLAQSLVAAGLNYDRAYQRVLEVQSALLNEQTRKLENDDLARRMADHLEQHEGSPTAKRYRLIRRVRALPKPLVVYIGGVSGTGKSTLSLEVAPLLRIYRINSTDTIRQVMRMVFNQAMLPSLHRSTFEMDESSDEQRVETALEEQAVQVCVGVRAVVERAVAENLSIFVEGVHLLPPLVPFADLDGAAYQVFTLMTTLDEEVHRSHLLARAVESDRPAPRYLDNLAVIRRHQRILLERATAYDLPVVDTGERENSVRETARVIIDHLETLLPSATVPARATSKTLLLLVDGLPDAPIDSLDSQTPLEAANTPNLDRLARLGLTGLADPVGSGVTPDTAAGTQAAFGVSPYSMKRGPIEAVGAGVELRADDIAIRGNFASFDVDGNILDRRAGRIRQDAQLLADAIGGMVLDMPDGLPVEVLVKPATEHRLAIVLRGAQLSAEISGSDPGDAKTDRHPLAPTSLVPGEYLGERTALALRMFEERAATILGPHAINQRRKKEGLPVANGLLTRGPGRFHQLTPPSRSGQALRISCVSADLTVSGVARSLGGKAVTDPAITANLDSSLEVKFQLATEQLEHNDLVVIHFKGADIAAHDRLVHEKVRYIERLDVALGGFLALPKTNAALESGALNLAVASDHTTYSETGQHGPEPVPILVFGASFAADRVASFGERSVEEGALGRFPLQQLIPRIFDTSLAPSESP